MTKCFFKLVTTCESKKKNSDESKSTVTVDTTDGYGKHWFHMIGALSRVPERALDNKSALGRMERDAKFENAIPDLDGNEGKAIKAQHARLLAIIVADSFAWMQAGQPHDCSMLVTRDQTHEYSTQMATESREYSLKRGIRHLYQVLFLCIF
jgi:hypothetical protein